MSYATLPVPEWLWGNDPATFFAEAELRAVKEGVGGNLWRVCTNESYDRTRPRLIRADPIVAMPGVPNFAILDALPAEPVRTPRLSKADVEQRRQRAEGGSLVDGVVYWQLMTTVLPLEELHTVIEDFQANLGSIQIAETGEQAFVEPENYLLTRSSALLRRLKMPSVWLRLAHDEGLARGELAHMNTALAAGETLFASGEALSDGVYLLDAYVGPLMASAAPGVWGFTSPRVSGTVLFSFGRAIGGTKGDAAELIQTLPSRAGSDRLGIPVPQVNARTIKSALNWWRGRLNDLFAVLGDPAAFVDSSGLYVPERQMQVMMTVEQLFRRTTSALLSHRDTNARRVLFFSVVDTLDRLTGRDFLWHCRSASAHATLDLLRSQVPDAAVPLLLPTAERAVKALDEVRDGFFIVRQTAATGISYTDGPSDRVLSVDEGAAAYLKVLRDATHGHGSNRARSASRTNALLAHHDGVVPHDLGLLAYLYLLDFLLDPERFRRVLASWP